MVEMMLSVSMLAIIFSMTIPAYRMFMVRNDLDIATNTLVQNLRRAQTLSQITDGDSKWGVHIQIGSILIYKGENFVLRDPSFDEDTEISTSIIITGLQTVTFAKKTGMPETVGTTTLTSTTNEIRNITINEKGMVDY